MNKKDIRDMNAMLEELLKLSMHGNIDTMWNSSEEELMEYFGRVMTTPDDENRPSLFTMMQMAGLIGTVLVSKYEKDEKDLMKILKDSDALFVKEIKHD